MTQEVTKVSKAHGSLCFLTVALRSVYTRRVSHGSSSFGDYLEDDVTKMAMKLSKKFNEDYKAVDKGLFSLLHSKGVCQKVDDDEW